MKLRREPWGSKIKGSCLFRVYCNDCGEPMRATSDQLYYIETQDTKIECVHECGECSPGKPAPAHTGLTPRQKGKLGHTQ